MPKYYRTTFFVEVLSTTPVTDNLAQLLAEDQPQQCVQVTPDMNQEVDGKQMAMLLRNQDCHASDLGLHDNGDPII